MRDRDLDLFLLNMVAGNFRDIPRVAGLTGGLVYAAIEVLDRLLSAFGVDLGGRTKLAMSLAGAAGLPVGAALLAKHRGLTPSTPNLWFLVTAAVAWSGSQIIHGALERNKCEP